MNWPRPPFPPTPDPPDVNRDRPDSDSCESGGSIIECQNQTLGESFPVAGTPFTLNYRSNRVSGRVAAYTLEIPISGDTVPGKVVSIELEVLVAGRRFTQSFSRNPGQSYTFTWDGKDAYDRTVQGEAPVTVLLGYKYGVCYWQCVWNESQSQWNCWENCPDPPATYATSWTQWQGTIGVVSPLEFGIGGWSLNINHLYNPGNRVLYLGNGSWTAAEDIGSVVVTAAGGEASTMRTSLTWSPIRLPYCRPPKGCFTIPRLP